MFVIIGTKNEVYQEIIGESFLDHYEDEVVATFDNEKDAKTYIRESKLKTPIRESFSAQITFKKGSLLRDYEDARVEGEEEKIPPPHNPTI